MKNKMKKVLFTIASMVFLVLLCVSGTEVQAAEGTEGTLTIGKTTEIIANQWPSWQRYHFTVEKTGYYIMTVDTGGKDEKNAIALSSQGVLFFSDWYKPGSYRVLLMPGEYIFSTRNTYSKFKVTISLYSEIIETYPETVANNNNSDATASVLPNVNASAKGLFTANDNQDVYKVKVPQDGKLTLSLPEADKNITVVIEDDFRDFKSTSYMKAGSTETYYVPAGNYYITMTSNSSGVYTLKTKYNELATSKVKSVKNSKSKQITAKWSRVAGATGYQVRISSNKKGTKKIKTVKISSNQVVKQNIKNKKLKKGKTFYVSVRTFVNLSTIHGTTRTIYSDWSPSKKIKMKK